MDAKATGGMVKLAAITVISILITRSPIMAEISAAAGGAEVTGAAANMIRTLVARHGQTAVQLGIKLAMASGTLATDVGLTLLNQVTSERGVNGEELWESAKGSAKYIYFGAYIGAPLAQAVSKQLGKIGATAKMFEGGMKSVNGAIQTTSITGDKLVQNLMKGGNKVLTTGGGFLTDVAAFSALEVATEGMDPLTAGKEQTEMLGKLKIMNHFIEYILGGKAHAEMAKARMDAAIERSGIKNWQIKEIKSPNKTVYEVEVGEGLPKVRFEDKNQLATAMLERVTANYETQNAREKSAAPKGKVETLDEAKTANPAENAKEKVLFGQHIASLRNEIRENLSDLVKDKEKLTDNGLKIILDICNNSISNKLKSLYQPIVKALSEMNSTEYKAFKSYLDDYESFLKGQREKEPDLYKYLNDNIFISSRLSITNLKKLSDIIDLVEANILPINYAKNIYYKAVNGLQIVKPESKFDNVEENYINLCKQHENTIEELDKIENMDYFCKQSFELLKNNMGLEDSGVNIKFLSGHEGGYYELETNTVYVNKNWAGEKIGCINNGGVKAEIFASIAHELTHARQWIEIIRNGWLEDMPEWKNKISNNPNGKYLLYYAGEIGSNECSLEKSCLDFNNWCNYKEPYKKLQKDGYYLKDSEGNLIIEKNSLEYQDYYTQRVEQEAFKNGHVILSQYNRIVKNNSPRICTTESIKSLFKDKKIDTNNNWYKQIAEFLKTVKTNNHIINMNPTLTNQDFEVMAMLINLKNGKYIDLWTKGVGENDDIPNIQKLAMFVRTMRMTHQTLDFLNFDENQWDIVVRGIINKPEELIIPVLKYKYSSRQINEAISDGSYKNNLDMLKIVTSIEKYLNFYTTQKEFIVHRGDLSFNMLKDVNIKNSNLKEIMENFYKSLSKIKDDKSKEKKVNDFINKIFKKNEVFVIQERFLSTAMIEKASEAYADKIFWNITVSSGINGMSIESFNMERLAEAEFLIQRGVKLIIENVQYDYKKNIFIFDASLEKVQTN